MINKVLIANRGEIALRIVRACREMGIKTLAVYSEADEQSLHVQLADEAICIGPAQASDSYLKSDRIISAAEISDADAIHAGYGFLAENADFVEQCETCKINFIGPNSSVIRRMGDKALAIETVKKAGVPTVPGSEGVVDSAKEALKAAEAIRYPVLIKAVAGGGGKGMRVAHNGVTFAKEYDLARAEAGKAFGNSSVYLEKLVENPRHIEFQILADKNGKTIHLGERDCSVQRRHQKLIEESPSPSMTEELRQKMGADAIRSAQAAGYENAGTVEFLLDEAGNYYFIEMNTRIQVEHPVTEEVTDTDLIKEQIRIAAGEPLQLEQSDIRINGHAIECRINAEDPSRNFAPSPGTIDVYYAPGGHGVRVDSHVYAGYTVPPYYDSMIGKLITFARNRDIALDRMSRALSEFIISGIKSTVPFSKAIMQDPVFRSGKASTSFVEDFFSRTKLDAFVQSNHNLESL